MNKIFLGIQLITIDYKKLVFVIIHIDGSLKFNLIYNYIYK